MFLDTGVFSGVRPYWKVIVGHQAVSEDLWESGSRHSKLGCTVVHRASGRVRGRSEATRQQHILGLPISAHTASASTIHSSVCLWVSTPPSLSSFLLNVYIHFINVAIRLFFSMLSRPSCKAEPTFGPLR